MSKFNSEKLFISEEIKFGRIGSQLKHLSLSLNTLYKYYLICFLKLDTYFFNLTYIAV